MKHVISRPLAVFIIILTLTVALPPLSLKLADGAGPLPAGYCVPAVNSPDSEKLIGLFEENGMLCCGSLSELTNEVVRGSLSMGVVIPDDFAERLKEGETNGVLTLLAGQSSVFEALEKTEIMSALFEVYAPYITLDSLDESGFEFGEDAVFASYYDMLDGGLLFSFEQQTVEGKAVEPVSRQNVFKTVLGLMLWIGMLLGVCIPLSARIRALKPAIGREKALRSIGVPAFVCAFIALAAAASAACVISGYGTVIVPAVLTLAVMGIAGLALCFAFPGGHVCTLVCVFLAALAPALCPGLSDISLVVPAIEKIRVICPVYWLWLL